MDDIDVEDIVLEQLEKDENRVNRNAAATVLLRCSMDSPQMLSFLL